MAGKAIAVADNNAMSHSETLAGLDRIRVTSWKMAADCLHTWHHQHMTGSAKQESGKWAKIGTAVHAVIEMYIRMCVDPELAQADGVDLQFKAHMAVIPPAEQQNLKEYLWGIHRMVEAGYRPVLIEHEFRVRLHGVEVDIVGHVDVVWLSPGGDYYLIHDHKTNRGWQPAEYWAAQMQPLLYAMMLRTMMPGLPIRFRIGYVNLPGMDVEWEVSPEQDTQTAATVAEIWAAMVEAEREGFWPQTIGDACRYCPLSSRCSQVRQNVDLFDRSMHDAMIGTPVEERYRRLKIVAKLAESFAEQLKPEVVQAVEAAGGRMQVGAEVASLSWPERRSVGALELSDALSAWLAGRGWPERETAVVREAYGKLFTAKVTGVDELLKLLPEAAEAVLPIIQKERAEEPTLTYREVGAKGRGQKALTA